VGGLPLAELNHLEVQFLILLDFNLMIHPAEIQFYADHLLSNWLETQRSSFMGIPPPAPTNLDPSLSSLSTVRNPSSSNTVCNSDITAATATRSSDTMEDVQHG